MQATTTLTPEKITALHKEFASWMREQVDFQLDHTRDEDENFPNTLEWKSELTSNTSFEVELIGWEEHMNKQPINGGIFAENEEQLIDLATDFAFDWFIWRNLENVCVELNIDEDEILDLRMKKEPFVIKFESVGEHTFRFTTEINL